MNDVPPQPTPRTLFERALLAVLLLMAVAFAFAFVSPAFDAAVYTEDDLIAYYLPMRAFFQECVQSGGNYTWMPYIFNGFYLHGDGEAAMADPVRHLVYRFLPLAVAFNVDLLIPYLLLLAGTVLLLRRLGVAPEGAMFAAITFAFCGFNLNHYVHPNLVATAALIPWSLWALDGLLAAKSRNGRAAWGSAIAVITAWQILQAFPQTMWCGFLAEVAFIACRWRRVRPSGLGHLVAAKGIAVLLGAVQWLPMKDMFEHSYRETMPAAEALSDSIHPLNLLQLFSPYLFHRRAYSPVSWDAVYIGAATIALVVWALARRKQLRPAEGRIVVAAAVIGVITFAFATGKYGHVYGWKLWIPVVNNFRSPSRLLFLPHLALCAIAAVGFCDVLRFALGKGEGRRARIWLVLPPLVSWGIAGLVTLARDARYEPTQAFIDQWIVSNLNLYVGASIVTAAACAVALAAGGRRWAVVALVAIAAGDIALYSFRHKDTLPLDALIASIERPPDETAFRVSQYYQPNFGVMTPSMVDIRTNDGYVTLKPDRRLDHTTEPALRLSAVKWNKVQYARTPEEFAGPDRGERWEPVPNPMPRARLMTRAVHTADMATAVETLNIDDVALVDAPLELDGGEPGSVQVIAESPGYIRCKVNAATRQLLVLSESYWDGWRAEWNGASIPAIPVYGDFLGAVVPPGEYEMAFVFEAESYAAGWEWTRWGAGLFILYLAFGAVPARLARRDEVDG